MSTMPDTSRVSSRISRKVDKLRWLVRAYVTFEGLAAIVLILGLAFWLGLGLDWLFEPPREVRILMFAGLTVALVFVAVKLLFQRAFRRLSNTSLALLLERSFPQFNESLVTTIESMDQPPSGVVGKEQLLQRSREVADETIVQINLSRVFRLKPLLWKMVVSVVLVLSVAFFAVWQSEAFAFWLDRIQLSDASWPRRVNLSVEGFKQEGNRWVAHVARDDDFQLRVMASITDGHSIPDDVEIRYRLSDGSRPENSMTKVGEALPGRDQAQEYQFTFSKMVEGIEFDLVGGDDRIRGLEIRVVERPQITKSTVECTPPTYLGRAAYSEAFSRRVELPEGTQANCQIESNKNLRSIDIHEPAREQAVLAEISSEDSQSFRFPVQVGKEDRVFLINMVDEDGVENREPYRIIISAIPDDLPEASVQLRGIGSAITPQATIPLEGRVKDQYGLKDIWYEYRVDQGEYYRMRFETEERGNLEVTQFDDFDLEFVDPLTDQRLLELHPGQKLSLAIQASDEYDLDESPRIGSSQRFSLNIVTESELRALLEKRELALRQRFEALFEKMVGIQELLMRIEVANSESTDTEKKSPGGRKRSRDLLRIDGALQNVVQVSYETIGVAEGFQDIVEELINNRIVTEELRARLLDGISVPLLEIGEDLLSQLEVALQEFHSSFEQGENAVVSHQIVLERAEMVLEAMQRVLDRMLELENYNELVELLRGIVSDHKQLQDLTKQKRREKLRSLLDE